MDHPDKLDPLRVPFLGPDSVKRADVGAITDGGPGAARVKLKVVDQELVTASPEDSTGLRRPRSNGLTNHLVCQLCDPDACGRLRTYALGDGGLSCSLVSIAP